MTTQTPWDNPPEIIRTNFDLDYYELDRELDRVKTKVFLGHNAAFLGSLMCSQNFVWSSDIPTAQTNGLTLEWNPYWFLSLPHNTRRTVLAHELWHPALLHMLRCGTRNPKVWNWACDIVINNMLYHQGFTFDGTNPWLDDSINRWKAPGAPPIGNFGTKPAEEIYDELIDVGILSIGGLTIWGSSTLTPGGEEVQQESDMVSPEGTEEEVDNLAGQIINKVVGAKHTAALTGGDVPSDVETMLKRFLQPKLPWELLLYRWASDLIEIDFSWRTRNRRHSEMYLPSITEDEGRLDHLLWFFDVSGSVTDKEVVRMNSEVKYIWETFSPKKLTIVLFDDKIQRTIVLEDADDFDEIVITGRGGTDLRPVREFILETSPPPTAAVIFSDLGVHPMVALPPEKDIPILWIGVNASKGHKVNMGEVIYIKE